MKSDPHYDQPPMNKALEDLLAMAGDNEDRERMLYAWLLLGAEYAARDFGRKRTIDKLENLVGFIKNAQPTHEWPE